VVSYYDRLLITRTSRKLLNEIRAAMPILRTSSCPELNANPKIALSKIHSPKLGSTIVSASLTDGLYLFQ
jgi:hypothetical protein